MLVYEFLILTLFLAKSSDALFGLGSKKAKFRPLYAPKTPGFFSWIAAGTRSRFNRLFIGHVDDRAVRDAYRPVEQQIKKSFDDSPCIEGVYVDIDSVTSFKMNLGNMTDLDWTTMITKIDKKQDKFATAKVQFVFPILHIEYSFSFHGRFYHEPVNDVGTIIIKHELPVTIEYLVKIPKFLKEIRSLVRQGKCVAEVQKVTSQLGAGPTEAITCEKIIGDFVVKGDATVSQIQKIVKLLTQDIQDAIQRSLVNMIEPIFRKLDFNCKDLTYKIPVPKAVKEDNCEYTEAATKFTLPPQ